MNKSTHIKSGGLVEAGWGLFSLCASELRDYLKVGRMGAGG